MRRLISVFIILFFSLSPWKSVIFHVNNLGFTLSKWCIVSSLVDIDTVTLEKKYPNCRRSILVVVATVIGLKYYRYGIKHYPINQLIFVNVFVTICLSSQISNQEAHGPLCSAEKQCKSITTFLQSYRHTITFINSVKSIISLRELNVSLFFMETWTPFTHGRFAPSLVGVNPVVL